MKALVRFLITLTLFVLATLIGLALWRHYLYSPWTRDGRVRANVVNVAPDVPGLVAEVAVRDNQFVHRGDVLFRLDAERQRRALDQARAALAAREADLAQRRDALRRRAQFDGVVVAAEQTAAARMALAGAMAQLDEARAALAVAQLNLDRSEVRAPADGSITNLHVFAGDYAVAGRPALALVEAGSYYVYGYFEETKLPGLHAGDPAEVRLMSGGPVLRGHVDSLSRGITDRDNATGQELLSNVNPTFNWVRLAQRVPVRIALDEVPAGLELVAGMTCTVTVRTPDRHGGRAQP
jgi:RND family efflux transporter MFP subunit